MAPSGEPWKNSTMASKMSDARQLCAALDPATGATCCFEMGDDGALVPDTAAHCC